jgi:hypothetical protein
MTCPVCATRKAKRACPALGQSIRTVCCGTKRLKEINCTPDCSYLASAQAHPPAAIQRQRERDLPLLVQLLEGLSDAQAQAMAHLHARIRAHRGAAIPAIRDADVAEAVQALAATLETASRGILYEHPAGSVPALRLQHDLRAALEAVHEQHHAAGVPPLSSAASAMLLRHIARAIERARSLPDAHETTFLDFVDRIGGPETKATPAVAAPASRIILP